MIRVTITGQLALLLLIERLTEVLGVEVISANTDGVTFRCHRDAVDEAQAVVREWETLTHFKMDTAEYTGIWSSDVSNYVAVKTNGDIKTKGVYVSANSLSKNPQNQICARAVLDYLTLEVPIRGTVYACQDVKQFLSARKVTGGAVWDGEEIGKVVRFYYSTTTTEPIRYKVNQHKVPDTDGARPCVVMPDGIPEDLDRERYCHEADAMLANLGVTHV